MGGRGAGGGGKGGKAGGGAAGAAAEDVKPVASAESQIEDVYNRLAGKPGDWVGIADIRDALPGLSRSEFDNAIRRIENQYHNANVVPESNQKALTERERRGAVTIGDQPKHFISMNNPY